MMKNLLRILALALCLLPFAVSVEAQGTTNYPTALDTTTTLPEAVDQKFRFLTAAVNTSATTITVNSTAGLPTTGVLQIDSELLSYTTATGTTFTVTRGFSGTTAAAHSANATIRFPLVSAHTNGTRGAVLEIEKKLGVGASNASAAATGDVLRKNSDGTTGWGAQAGGAVTSVFGRTGAVLAATNDYTWAQIDKTTSSLADLATRSASDLSSGTLPAARMPALTGDVTTSAGSVATTLASVVSAGSCTNCSVTWDAKGRITAASSGTGGGTTAYARAYRTTNLAVSSAWTTVPLDAETDDSGTIHSNTTNNSRLTAPTSGFYTMGASVYFTGSGTGCARFLINGTTALGETCHASNAIATEFTISTMYGLAASDYVELQVYNSASVTLATVGTSQPSLYMARNQ